MSLELTVLELRNQRVLTTKQLAEVYETQEKNIQMNFSNNKERFIEGKHYFMLSGEQLKEFKNSLPNDIGEPLKFVPQLILWTEKGASRMCKILDTDKSWEQFDKLEETYFNIKNKTNTNYFYMIEKTKCEIGLIDILANSLNINNNSKLILISKSFENNGINTNLLPSYTKSEGVLKSATELLKDNDINISTIKFNSLLVRKGILKELTRESSKGKPKKFKSIVNTYYGENQVNPKSPKETQPLYYEDKFKELLKEINII